MDEPDQNQAESERFEWKSTAQHITVMLAYLMEWGAVANLLNEECLGGKNYGMSFIHYGVMAAFAGYPIIYFQNFIGQYTRRGYLFSFAAMFPIFQGLGWTMTLITVTNLAIQLYYTEKIVNYFFVALSNIDVVWMKCFQYFLINFPNCFSLDDFDLCSAKNDFDHPCFEPGTRVLSAYLFERDVIFNKTGWHTGEGDETHISYYYVSYNYIFHYGLLFTSLVILLKYIRQIDFTMLLVFCFSLTSLLSLSVLMISKEGAVVYLVELIFSFDYHSLFDWDVWKCSFLGAVKGLKLCEGTHVLYGSFIPASEAAPHRTLQLLCSYILLLAISLLYIRLFEGQLVSTLFLSISDLGLNSEESTVFVTYPTVLGLEASAYLFSLVYFFVLLLISINAMVLRVMAIEQTISEIILISSESNRFQYYFYIRFAICTLALVGVLPMLLLRNSYAVDQLNSEVRMFELITVIMQMLMVFMYGYERMCDDIHFLRRSQAPRFLKIFSLLVPAFSAGVLYDMSHDIRSGEYAKYFQDVYDGLWCVPMAACILLQVVIHIRRKNLLGLIRPTDEYGPPSLEQRIYRVLYNPRFATRYKRQREICQHVCLLKSEAVSVALQQELGLLKKFTGDLENTEEENSSYTEMIRDLKKIEKLLMKRMKHA